MPDAGATDADVHGAGWHRPAAAGVRPDRRRRDRASGRRDRRPGDCRQPHRQRIVVSAARSHAMKYLCLVYGEEQDLHKLTPEGSAKLDASSLAYDRSLEAKGHLIAAEALQS